MKRYKAVLTEHFLIFGIHLLFSCIGMFYCLLLLTFLQNSRGVLSDSTYLIGLGTYDITGPAADVNMMGYANPDQVASGIHFRLKARSFIVAEPDGNCVVFVNFDACMASQIVTIKVIERLKSRYGNLYTEQNVAISGIHTHAGPGGYLQYVVYIVTSLGFVRQSFDIIVDGIEKSIIQAHNNLRPGSIYINAADRLKQLASSFKASGGRQLTDSKSMYQRVRTGSQPYFVSAFCQTNCGDVSPNVLGTFCTDTGLPCDFNHSTCNGKNELCYGRGPG